MSEGTHPNTRRAMIPRILLQQLFHPVSFSCGDESVAQFCAEE
jgi:hypothetical protein